MSAHVVGFEVDALFPDEKLIVELDSWQFHSGRASFEGDRDRDATTLAAGFGTVRITWERMRDRPGAEAQRLQQILQRCRRDAA
jgi:very-short-patch-repair endonuclease